MVLEYRVNWSTGGQQMGTSVFHGRAAVGASDDDAAQDLADRVQDLFDAIDPLVAAIVWSFPSEVLELDTSTGVLTEVIPVTPPASVSSTGTGAYAAPAGARWDWGTPAIVAGRRLKGRTFLVPIAGAHYDSVGTLTSGAIGSMTTAGTAFIDDGIFVSSNPVVWSRTHGVVADITTFTIPDQVAVLRSRK